MARESGQNVLGLMIGNFDQGGIARMTLDQRDDLAALRTAQQIPFPVTGNGSVFDLRGSLSNRDRLGDLAAPILASALARVAEASPSAQMLDELFFQHPASLDEQALVDRFMRYLHALIVGVADLQPSRDLPVSYRLSTRPWQRGIGPTCGLRFANGTNGAQWHNIVFDRCKGAAQVLDCTGLNGGPCSHHTYVISY